MESFNMMIWKSKIAKFSSNLTADNDILPSNVVLNKNYGNKLNSVCFTPENVTKSLINLN